MGEVQQRFLAAAAALALLVPALGARKFYDDDPLWTMPKPLDVGKPAARKLSEYYDFFYMTFGKPGEKSTPAKPIKAGAINTLGEVPDSFWYTNRHGRKPMTIEELVRGPGTGNPPILPLNVTSAKTEGVTPGFTVKDAKGRKYQIKFDTRQNFELATGADVMGSKFFYALGYFTPENYIVYFGPEQLQVAPGTKFIDYRGVERPMEQRDVANVLADIPRDKSGRWRAIASLFLQGTPIGPFRYHGVRTDDPNDTVPHENRRDLRGLKVFGGWLQHTDNKSQNSFDTVIEQDGVKVIRHHLIDFSAAIGSDAFEPKSPRAGHVYLLDWPDAAKTFFTLGLYLPDWTTARYKYVREHGRIGTDAYHPEEWKGHYYNPAIANCLPDDGFWAAKQVIRFTEPEIRAIVNTGQYSDKEAGEHLVKVLRERQQMIGRTYFSLVLPLDNFRVDRGTLAFDDLGVKYGFYQAPQYTVTWSRFDNESETKTPIASATGMHVPSADGYLAADIHAGNRAKSVTVFLRGGSVIGVERTWQVGEMTSSRGRGSELSAFLQ